MSAEYFASLDHYVYGWRNKGTDTYAYIGVGVGSRAADHLSEDKSGHPEFQEYLESLGDEKLYHLDLLATNLETKRGAELLEAYLIEQYHPQLNRNKGMVRGATLRHQSFELAREHFELNQWDTKKEIQALVAKYGMEIITDITDVRKTATSVKFFTPTVAGIFSFISFEKQGCVFGFMSKKDMVPAAHIAAVHALVGEAPHVNPTTSSTTQDAYVMTVSDPEAERKLFNYIMENQK